jgi:acetyl-CoA carboxylase biotin carboxyl carrier protein
VDIKADVASVVWQITVEVGKDVLQGETVVILESMKMEIPVEAPADGKITEILVSEGDSVQEGEVLARLS